MPAIGISIIICCYNSAARLPETIKHLAIQCVPQGILWEVIIVNNASTDDTKLVANAEWAKYNTSAWGFKIVDEQEAGLSFAREKGIRASKFNYIIFYINTSRVIKHG